MRALARELAKGTLAASISGCVLLVMHPEGGGWSLLTGSSHSDAINLTTFAFILTGVLSYTIVSGAGRE